ncbi:MAG TPA: hypothetical protein VFZ34_04920, partial [Blastocatellia bacterium]|nr:hypothetical protein [Blastocatellia bacterium]
QQRSSMPDMEEVITLDAVFQLAKQLSALDKVRLVEGIAAEIERDLQAPKPRQSLRGLWKGAGITDEDIAEIRHEMWADFPRAEI